MEINPAGVDKSTKTESNNKEPFPLHSFIKNTHILPEKTDLLSLESPLQTKFHISMTSMHRSSAILHETCSRVKYDISFLKKRK